MTLNLSFTSDLENLFLFFPLAWRILVTNFIEIFPQYELSCHTKICSLIWSWFWPLTPTFRPWKLFQLFPLTWTYISSFIEILAVNKETSCRKYVLTFRHTDEPTDGWINRQMDNSKTLLPLPIVGHNKNEMIILVIRNTTLHLFQNCTVFMCSHNCCLPCYIVICLSLMVK